MLTPVLQLVRGAIPLGGESQLSDPHLELGRENWRVQHVTTPVGVPASSMRNRKRNWSRHSLRFYSVSWNREGSPARAESGRGFQQLICTIGQLERGTRQLSGRAHRLYLFRGEYIFDLETAVVVETPQLGHATYVFTKPRSMEGFLALYTRINQEDVRRNRDNIGERLGFLGRVIHGANPRAWLQEIRQRIGEKVDFSAVVRDGLHGDNRALQDPNE